MSKQVPFRLNRSGLILALISAGFASQAGAAAGRVEFVTGGAVAQGADGRERSLLKGQDLDKGDTVKTNNGRAQIRFTDGAYVSLQPNTEFSIKDYNYEGKADGSERGFFGLAKGAMRAVTGLIGRVNRNRYQITTPTATVGIRGTGGLIAVNSDGSTLIQGSSGIWTLTNPSGTLDIPAGTAGLAPSTPNRPPQQTSQGPSVGPAPVQPQNQKTTTTPPDPKPIDALVNTDCLESSATCDPNRLFVTGNTTTTVVPNPNPPLVSGAGYHVSYAYGTSSSTTNVNSSSTLANAVFDTAGMLTQFSAANSASLTSGSQPDFGTLAGVVAWGRWIGSFSVTEPTAPGPLSATNAQGFHYVVGMPATAIPTGGSASFTLVGATSPTGSDGSVGLGTFNGTMSVNFGATASLTLSGNVAFAGGSPFTYGFNGTASTVSAGSAAFTGSIPASVISGTAPTAYSCSSGCTATINGAFFGTGATYAGYAYKIIAGVPQQSATGVAVFKQ